MKHIIATSILTGLGWMVKLALGSMAAVGVVTDTDYRSFSHIGTNLLAVYGGSVASIAGLQTAPTGFLTEITGTNQLTGISLPYAGFEGMIALLPTAAFTGATGGTAGTAIGKAFTAVAGKVLFMTFCKKDGLWYPSY